MDAVWERLLVFLDRLKALAWRGLVVLHSTSYNESLAKLAEAFSERGECLVMALSEHRGILGDECRKAGPPDLPRLLGTEYDYALIAVPGLLRPNIVAGVAETVREGGVLALLLPPIPEWNPGPPGGTGLYREYLLSSLGFAKSLFWADMDRRRVLAETLPSTPAPPRERRVEWKSRHGVPRALRGMTATRSQAEGLEAFAELLRGRARSLVLLGNRGRGKSFLIGLGLALAVYWHAVGRAEVVVPSLGQAEPVAKGLIAGLEALGHRGFRVKRLGGVVARVTGPWYRIRFSTPEAAEPSQLLVVDEAGAVGVARTRRLAWRSGRVVVSTTIHGYEGSGRAVAHLLLGQLPKPIAEKSLEEPIRYRPGDPLEEWVYRVFLLDVEPPATSVEARETACEEIDKNSLAKSPEALRRVFSVLVLAHYRNEPDDILALLESKHHELYGLRTARDYVAVADVAWEEPGKPREERLGLALLTVHGGEAAEGLRGARIVRIAVTPPLQGKGYGSRLLACIEREAVRRRVDVVTAVFSRHDAMRFWARNGYRVVYMSPRYNRVTGEKNVEYAKPFTARGERVVVEASRGFRARLLLSSQSIYRDVAAEKMPLLLSSSEPLEYSLPVTVDQARRLELFLQGSIDYEQASDPVYLASVSCLARKGFEELGLSGREAVAFTARVLQGKPLNDVAEIIGAGVEEASRIVTVAARRVAECGRAYLHTITVAGE